MNLFVDLRYAAPNMPLPKMNITKFLKFYENRPCLWDPSDEDYRYNTVRSEALKSIIEDMKLTMTVNDLRTKIKNIRTTYHREVTKITESKKNSDSDEIYTPQMSWFSIADRFLRPAIEGKSRRKCDATKENNNSAKADCSSSSSDENSETEPVKKKTKHINVPIVKDGVFVTLPGNNWRDEFDTFGQHVANQLRGLPLKNAFVCQNFINNFISQERLRVLETQQASPLYLPFSRPASSTSEYKYDPSSPGLQT